MRESSTLQQGFIAFEPPAHKYEPQEQNGSMDDCRAAGRAAGEDWH
jgi:hypothetical protein